MATFAKNFNAEYMTDFSRKEATESDIFRSLSCLSFNRPSFATLLTKAMLAYNGRTFVYPLDYSFVSDSFNSKFNECQLLSPKVSIEVQARKFTQYNLGTNEPLGIRCWITGCSVRDLFSLLRCMPGIGDRLDYICDFLDEAARYISSWNNNNGRFFFDIVYNHTQNRDSPVLEAKKETGKVFLPGGYMIGNTADWFIYSRLKPHLNVMEVSHALSLRGERSSIRLALTRKGTESSLVFSPPETGHLWGSCYVDPKITDLTLNEGQMTEADLALIDMAGLKDELLLDMPYDLSQTDYLQNTKRSYK